MKTVGRVSPKASSEDNIEQNKGHWNIETQSPYILRNDPPLEKDPTAEPVIETGTF